jgi:quercetin dioxygenase-like cupin family protein
VAERERERDALRTEVVDPRLYYDYEGRFIKQRLERDRMRLLPRVVPPAMFAPGGHALGDVRVFERYTAGPLSMLTCRFLRLDAGAASPEERRVPSLTMFVLDGSGTCFQEGVEHAFTEGDVVFVPPYTRYRMVAGPSGLHAWIPETRLWHVLGLLWHEHFEAQRMPAEVEPVTGADGTWSGYRIPHGVLGLDHELRVPKGEDQRRAAVFAGRRRAGEAAGAGGAERTWYDVFLRRLAEESRIERETPRVVRGAELPWEDTRQGRLKYYLSNWSGIAGQDLDLAVYDLPAGGHSGRHRHVAEELLLVVEGSGHDVHDGGEHPWQAGDLICVPPMTEHQHFADGAGDARLVTVWTHHPANEFLGGVEHIADASSWEAR